MKTLLSICLLFFHLSALAALPEAQELLKNWKDAMYTTAEESTMRMTITPPKEDPIVREADVYYRSEKDKNAKVLMRFTSPPKIKGTAFLSLKERNDSLSDQWIFFPAYNKARRLSSRKKSDAFLDSDFSNGDISFEYHEGFKFKVLREDILEKQPVYVLEGTTTTRDSVYSKQVLYIAKKNHLNVRAQFFDKSGKLFKELTVEKWTKYGDRWAVDSGVMKNLENQSTTRIEFIKRDTSSVPPEKFFTLSYLERGR